MTAETYVGRWTVIIRDEDPPGQKRPAWKEALPPGACFYVARDALGDYWFLPTPELKAPMNKRYKLTASDEKHGEFEVGVLLPGSLYADLGAGIGKLFMSVNLIDEKHRMLNMSQSHGGLHGLG